MKTKTMPVTKAYKVYRVSEEKKLKPGCFYFHEGILFIALAESCVPGMDNEGFTIEPDQVEWMSRSGQLPEWVIRELKALAAEEVKH